MKRFLKCTVTMLLLFAFCAAAFPGLRAEAAAPEKIAADGEYTLFTMEVKGRQTDPAVMKIESSLILNQDGTGKMAIYGMETALSKWTEKDGAVTLEAADGSSIEGKLEKGVLELEMGEGTYLYYAHEGADTKDFKTDGHPTGSMLYAFFQGIDPEKDVHLRYTRHTDYLNADTDFDTQARDNGLYSLSRIKVSGHESESAKLLKDGVYYALEPASKTATVVMEGSLTELVNVNVLLLDDFYSAMWEQVMRTDYTAEERELDGVKYKAEVFPIKPGEEEYGQEMTFYFNDKGEMVHIVQGASKLLPDMGETAYTLTGLDDKVDEKLFDLTGYKIERLNLDELTSQRSDSKEAEPETKK